MQNPYGAEDVADALELGLLMRVGIAAWAVSLILRFRRAAHGQRQQIKWVALGGGIACAAVIVFASRDEVVGEEVAPTSRSC